MKSDIINHILLEYKVAQLMNQRIRWTSGIDMRFKSVIKVEKLNKRKVITHSIIQFTLTLFLLYSSFFIIGVPI